MKRLLFCVLACIALSACATSNEMAITSATPAVDVSQKSIVLMTLTMRHQSSTWRVPKVLVVYIETPDAQDKAERQNYLPDGDGTVLQNGTVSYELRMAIAPGPYVLQAVGGTIRVFPFIADFQVPLAIDFTVPPHEVVYVGHVDATLRPWQNGDFRAGPLLPLVDQAAMGVSDGSFDVHVQNHSTQDLAAFRQNFPALRSADIKVQILPPFDREKAFLFWQSEPP